MRLNFNQSIWQAISRERRIQFQTLEKQPTQQHYNVVVIGGGITGLSVATRLKEEHQSIALLEADTIGSGVTGYTTSKLSAIQRFNYSKIAQHHNEDIAQKYYELNIAGINLIEENMNKYNIDCNFKRIRNYLMCTDESDLKKLRKEYQILTRIGVPVELVSENFGLPPKLESQVIQAIAVDNEAQFNVLDYLYGLAEAFDSEETPIYEHTRVINVSKKSPHTIECANEAKLTADFVVFATHIPILDISGHFATMVPKGVLGLAFYQNDQTIPEHMYITSNEPIRSIRSAIGPEGEPMVILVGNDGTVGERDTMADYEDLVHWAQEYLEVSDPVYKWYAHDYVPPDKMAYIGYLTKASKTLFTGTGYSKWGLSAGSAAALVISDLIHERRNEYLPAVDATRWDFPGALKDYVETQMKITKHVVGDRLKDITASHDIEDINPGEGCIRRYHGKPVGIYRDPEGQLHSVGVKCKHLGCHVRWNASDTTWDCPCHGSRYDYDGNIIHGPTVYPLDKVNL